MTEIFRGFPQSIQSNAEIVPKLGHERFLPYPCHFTDYLIFRRLRVSETLIASFDRQLLNSETTILFPREWFLLRDTVFFTSLGYATLFVTWCVPKSGADVARCLVFSAPELSLVNAAFTDK